MGELLSREAIFAAADMTYEDVEVPEWGGTVRVKSMTLGERDALEQSLIQGRGNNREMNFRLFRARLIIATTIDRHGRPLFTDADVEALRQKSSKPIERIVNVALRLSGLSEQDVEGLVKNSKSGQGEDSTSA